MFKIQKRSVAFFAFMLSSSIGSTEETVQVVELPIAAVQQSQDTHPLPSPVEIPKEFPSRLQIGVDYTYIRFSPDGNPSFSGNLGGITFLYEYRPLNDWYAGAKFFWKQGNMNKCCDSFRSIIYINLEERFGYTAILKKNISEMSVYSGLGYHYIFQGLTTTDNTTPLRFGYNEFYIPIGFALNNNFLPWFAWGFNGTWMPQIFSIVSLHPLGGALWTVVQRLCNFRVESPFDFALTQKRNLRLLVIPFYEYWQDGHSIADTRNGYVLGLPGNTYNFVGLDVNVSYSF